MKPRKIKKYGFQPSLPDHRDKVLAGVLSPLPPVVNLVTQQGVFGKGAPRSDSYMSDPFNQLHLGSCTGNAAGGVAQYMRRWLGLPDFTPSILMIYYGERFLEGSIPYDSGAMGRDAFKWMTNVGMCPQELWPYDITRFAEKPPDTAYTESAKHLVTSYAKVPQTELRLKSALALGLPIAFGFTVYESFETDAVRETGMLPMPGPSEGVLGGHEVVLCGYDDAPRLYLCRNSYGKLWGIAPDPSKVDCGYFWMPYDYVHNPNLATDFWTITAIGG